MRNLKEAIAFFATHPVYRNNEHIKQIYEIGWANIESEFGNLVRSSCLPIHCLDDDYVHSKKRHCVLRTQLIKPIGTTIVCSVFQNVKTEVEVLRQIVYDSIGRVLAQSQKVVDAYEGNFAVLLPLAKFLVRHANQLAALSENVGQRGLYTSLQSSLFSECVQLIKLYIAACQMAKSEADLCRRMEMSIRECVQLIKLYIDRLSNGQIGGRFVSEDGNVHPVSSGTVNFLKLLVQHKSYWSNSA
uniref:Exocyst complex component Sec8 n=1 Tax=Globodera pallida TaxID=36090 RepID=A0A183BMC7_GLOPA